ncbi:MAG: hypothetical protein ACOH10_12860 [Rhodoglobus sp.]
MTDIDEKPLVTNDGDLDRAARADKWRIVAVVLAFLLAGAVTWSLVTSTSSAKDRALSEASQKFTLAQQVAAACAVKEQADDLGGLCASATQIVKEGPAGSPGLQGPPGHPGPQGPLGPKGEVGALGFQGIQGAQGVQGLNGLAGPQGIFGEPGQNGSTGPEGPAGPVGANGPTGAIGPAGTEAGPTGPEGPTGTTGMMGATGPAGPEGPAGLAGPIGPIGATGPAGPSAFPFTFTFSIPGDKTVTCTIVDPTATATCDAPA